jgi:hypothetical protein
MVDYALIASLSEESYTEVSAIGDTPYRYCSIPYTTVQAAKYTCVLNYA